MGRRRRNRDDPQVPDAIFQPQPRSLAPLIRDYVDDFAGRALTEVEDRRFYHPLDSFQPAMEIGGRVAQKPKIKKTKLHQLPWQMVFDAPKKTAICVRRKTRREVIFAKRKSGGGARRKPRRNTYSDIGC